MFVSLNRKIIYSIVFLFLMTSLIFVYTFYIVYGTKIQEEQNYNIQRNQQYLDLLNRSIAFNGQLRQLADTNPGNKMSDELSALLQQTEQDEHRMLVAQRRIVELTKSFDERYNAISASIRLFIINSTMLVVAIFLLGYLITRWILQPLNRIATASSQVSTGNLTVRIEHEHAPSFTDEFDDLTCTFNKMLDNLENVLSEVKDKEAFLQALIDNIPDGIRVLDKDNNQIIANKAYYKQSKAKSSNLSINSASMVLPGKKNYTVESIRDLSEDINFSHQQKLSSLGFLSTSIAHEMKNNLGALRLIFELVLNKYGRMLPANSEARQQLELINNELLRCIEVPERLLKLTRSDSALPQPFNCVVELKDIISLMDYEAKSRGISIVLESPSDLPSISGLSTDFKMVAINLILNALKAMEAGGILTIITKQSSATKVQIDFKDTGCGIASENLQRIFEPFYSATPGVSSNRGNGLGLAIVRNLINKLGGTIKVISKLGKGSCFTITLPIIKNLAKK